MALTQLTGGLIEPGTIQQSDLSTEITSNISSAFAAANSASLYANAAFAVANSGITDSWSRDAANGASSYANSAYAQANTATTNASTADQRSVTSGSYANSAYSTANTATTNAATADQRAVTSGSYANSAYGQANTATTNAATADQRAVTSGSYANSAYGAANTATTNAGSASSYANSAYGAANTATTNAATADQRAVTSGSYANGAFAAANTADQEATSAGSYANGAYLTANSASSYANGAFARANNSLNTATGGTVTGAVTVRATNAIRSEAASTQDAVVIAGRAGGTSSFSANITPTTLTATRTVTIPDENLTIGFRNIPAVGTKTSSYELTTSDVGKYVQVGTGGSITIPDAIFEEGDAVNIFNNTSGSITITCSITTAYIAGADADVASVSLATRGMATILFISSTVCVIVGNVT